MRKFFRLGLALVILINAGCGDLASFLDEGRGDNRVEKFSGNLADSPELYWLKGSWEPANHVVKKNDILFTIDSRGTTLTIKQRHDLYPKDPSLEPKNCLVITTSSAFQMKKIGQAQNATYTITSEPFIIEIEDDDINPPECALLVQEMQERITAWKTSNKGAAWRENFSFSKVSDSTVYMNGINRHYNKL